MASNIYNKCPGQISDPDGGSRILCWGALIAYIDAIRIKNGLDIIKYGYALFGGGHNMDSNTVSQGHVRKFFGSSCAVPRHAVAFYVLTKYFDDFVIDGIGSETELNNLYEQCLQKQIYDNAYTSQYPVFIYSLADFTKMFNFLCTDADLSSLANSGKAFEKAAAQLDEDRVNM